MKYAPTGKKISDIPIFIAKTNFFWNRNAARATGCGNRNLILRAMDSLNAGDLVIYADDYEHEFYK